MGLLIILASAFSLVAHLKMRSYLAAVVVSSVSSAVLVQVVSYFELGHLDSLVLVAFTVSLIIGGTLSALLGALIRRTRPKDG